MVASVNTSLEPLSVSCRYSTKEQFQCLEPEVLSLVVSTVAVSSVAHSKDSCLPDLVSIDGPCAAKRVRFARFEVTEVRLRPRTEPGDIPHLFYSPEDVCRFRCEAKCEHDGDEDIDDDSSEIEFNLVTASVSVILATVFLCGCVLYFAEQLYRRANAVSPSPTVTSSSSSSVATSLLSHTEKFWSLLVSPNVKGSLSLCSTEAT